MNSILIQQKARSLRAGTRRQMLAALVVPLIVIFFYLFCTREFPQLEQPLHYPFAAVLAWSVLGSYFLIRGTQSEAMPGGTGLSSGLESCRRELDWQRKYYGRVLLWSFGPIVLAISALFFALAVAAGGEFLRKAMPLLMLAVLWVALYFAIWVRKRRNLQREIDDLAKVERLNK